MILLVKDLTRPSVGGGRTNLVLFILTLASVIFTAAIGAVPASVIPCDTTGSLAGQWNSIVLAAAWSLAHLYAGLPFALSFLAVLGSHEFGHYLAGRKNKTAVTLPFFIPLPLISPFGTLGAVISMREPPRNRNVLTEIGIAGPLTGFLVAIPILIVGPVPLDRPSASHRAWAVREFQPRRQFDPVHARQAGGIRPDASRSGPLRHPARAFLPALLLHRIPLPDAGHGCVHPPDRIRRLGGIDDHWIESDSRPDNWMAATCYMRSLETGLVGFCPGSSPV